MSLVANSRSTEIPASLLDELLSISRYAAHDVCLVQGSGGNTSVKTVDTMWIKASGLTMADVGTHGGYVAIDLQLALEMLRVGRWNNDLLSTKGRLRHSMEAGFHALLGHVVLHTHPVYLNALACMEGGKEALQRLAPGAAHWGD
ncbi:MAG: class II aldolase/adducin family protein, partial [Acidobacteriaceae bacterium]|nr:class II aldolase/adducin family protein [Acidobacteriaceae bacterium]